MLMRIKFMKDDDNIEIFDKLTSPGFSHGTLTQAKYSSVLRLGELVEESVGYILVWAKNLQGAPFQRGIAWYKGGGLKLEAHIVDNYSEKDWALDYEIQLIVNYSQNHH